MTEQPTISFDHSALTPSERDTMEGWLREDLQSGKISQATYDQFMTPAQPTPVPATAPNPAAVNTGAVNALSIAERLKAGTLTTAQAGQLARAGGLDVTEVAKALQTLNEPIPQKVQEAQDPKLALLNQHHQPAANDSDYVISLPPGLEITTPEDKELERQARRFLRAMEFPVREGNALAAAVGRRLRQINDATAGMSREGRDGYIHAHIQARDPLETDRLVRVHRDKYEPRLGGMRDMISEVEKTAPGLRQFIKANLHAFGDAEVISLFEQQAGRYWMRRGQ